MPANRPAPEDWQRWAAMARGAAVRRYHNKRPLFPQDVGQHTQRMLMLLLIMFGNKCSPLLLQSALVHDLAEGEYGDVPAPTKRLVPSLKDSLDKLEGDFLAGLGLDYETLLGPREKRWLKLADNLEGYLYSDEEVRLGNVAFVPTRANFAAYIRSMGLEPHEWLAVLKVLPPNHDGPLTMEESHDK